MPYQNLRAYKKPRGNNNRRQRSLFRQYGNYSGNSKNNHVNTIKRRREMLQAFLRTVKSADQPNLYINFIVLFKTYFSKKITEQDFLAGVKKLFRSHPNLLGDFNYFLPITSKLTLRIIETMSFDDLMTSETSTWLDEVQMEEVESDLDNNSVVNTDNVDDSLSNTENDDVDGEGSADNGTNVLDYFPVSSTTKTTEVVLQDRVNGDNEADYVALARSHEKIVAFLVKFQLYLKNDPERYQSFLTHFKEFYDTHLNKDIMNSEVCDDLLNEFGRFIFEKCGELDSMSDDYETDNDCEPNFEAKSEADPKSETEVECENEDNIEYEDETSFESGDESDGEELETDAEMDTVSETEVESENETKSECEENVDITKHSQNYSEIGLDKAYIETHNQIDVDANCKSNVEMENFNEISSQTATINHNNMIFSPGQSAQIEEALTTPCLMNFSHLTALLYCNNNMMTRLQYRFKQEDFQKLQEIYMYFAQQETNQQNDHEMAFELFKQTVNVVYTYEDIMCEYKRYDPQDWTDQSVNVNVESAFFNFPMPSVNPSTPEIVITEDGDVYTAHEDGRDETSVVIEENPQNHTSYYVLEDITQTLPLF